MNKIKIGLAVLVAISAALHVLVLFHSQGASFDITSYSIQAATVMHHQNIYNTTTRYPYPPVWVFITALCSLIATGIHASFMDIVRVPGILGDLGITIVLGLFGIKKYGTSYKSLMYPALYALNPLAILISAGHGQFDSLAIFFTILAILLLPKRPLLAALLLGVAIALKGYPVLLLPYFVWQGLGRKQMTTVILALAPVVIAVGGYTIWAGWSGKIITNVLGYHPSADFGWGVILNPLGAFDLRLIFEIIIVVVVILLSRRKMLLSPIYITTIIFMVFYAVNYDLSVQYLMWVIPFLIVYSWRWSVVYTIGALLAAITFYAAYFPGALPFPSPFFLPSASTNIYALIVMLPTLIAIFYLYGQFYKKQLSSG